MTNDEVLFSIDSNILIYAEGTADVRRRDIALSLLEDIGPARIILPMQTVGETVNWMMRKGHLSRAAAVDRVSWWLDHCTPSPVEVLAFRSALILVEKHSFQIWDAVILSASADAGAQFLLSEDMQHGFRWNGVTVLNPFILTAEQRATLAAGRTLH